jgi:hypothetical protein
MDELDLQLDDVLLFELSTFEESQAFRLRLRPRWPGWSHDDEQGWLFACELRDGEDLALLLREAEAILVELGRVAVRFLVDGRVYVLEPSADRKVEAA